MQKEMLCSFCLTVPYHRNAFFRAFVGADSAALAVVHIDFHLTAGTVNAALRAINPAEIAVNAGRLVKFRMEGAEAGVHGRQTADSIAGAKLHALIRISDMYVSAYLGLIHACPPPFTNS